MRSFKVQGGDLVLDSSNRAGFVVGKDKLIQDLALWMMEPKGVGFLTPAFGSLLPSMIGSSNMTEQVVRVEMEVRRILSLYQANQLETIKEARRQGRLYVYSRQEILNSVDDIRTEVQLDRVMIHVLMSTAAQQRVNLNLNIDAEGVLVGQT